MVNSPPAESERLDAVFRALADPTRRAIVARLSAGTQTVTALATPFDMSLPAVVKHLRVLERAGLVQRRRAGREKHCRLVAAPLDSADEWLNRYRDFWQARLGALDSYLTGKERRGPDIP
jgi:DNA-binding transcriptional ArsR family regulator